MKYYYLIICLILGFFLGCTSTQRHADVLRGPINPLPYVVWPFTPDRYKEAYDHTLVKFYRSRSDCMPECPRIDIWRYEYKPNNGPVLHDTKPIASRKEFWKAQNEARIMAVTLYGDQSIYYEGLSEYIDSFKYIKEMNGISDPLWGYETFTVRVYVAKRNPKLKATLGDLKGETPDAFIKILLDKGCEVVYVDNHMPSVGKDATFWRFMVLGEEMPDHQAIRYISRDADWRLTAGEAYSVGEWIALGQQYHRLNMPMCYSPLNASVWGGMHTGKGTFQDIKTRIEYFPYRLYYGDDEMFLRDEILPFMKASDSFLTHYYPVDVLAFLGNPYLHSCEQPTQPFCELVKKDAKCVDVQMPSDVLFPYVQLGLRHTLADLKEHPKYFDMHLNTPRGQRVKKAFSVKP